MAGNPLVENPYRELFETMGEDAVRAEIGTGFTSWPIVQRQWAIRWTAEFDKKRRRFISGWTVVGAVAAIIAAIAAIIAIWK